MFRLNISKQVESSISILFRIKHKGTGECVYYRIRSLDLRANTPESIQSEFGYMARKSSEQLIRNILRRRHGKEWRRIEIINHHRIQKSIKRAINYAR